MDETPAERRERLKRLREEAEAPGTQAARPAAAQPASAQPTVETEDGAVVPAVPQVHFKNYRPRDEKFKEKTVCAAQLNCALLLCCMQIRAGVAKCDSFLTQRRAAHTCCASASLYRNHAAQLLPLYCNACQGRTPPSCIALLAQCLVLDFLVNC